jgi:hypothetical protein
MPRKYMKIKFTRKTTNPELLEMIAALKKENARLQKRIAKIEVNSISNENRVAAFKAELEKRPSLTEIISAAHRRPPLRNKKS